MAFLEETARKIKILFQGWAGEPPEEIKPLPAEGSQRSYFRVTGKTKNAIAASNPDKRENEAFIYLSRHLHKKGFRVPEIYSFQNKNDLYLIRDLGNDTLFDRIIREKPVLSEYTKQLINQSIESLARLQTVGSGGLNWGKCYPRSQFDAQSIQWDLEYFKYHFLKVFNIAFDEQKLEEDFNTLKEKLLEAGQEYFMHRDFQSRNIMIYEDNPYFIDYQGGRKGPLQYDIVSFLFQVKAGFSWAFKMESIEFYKRQIAGIIKNQEKEFNNTLFLFAYLRIMQVFGAYGYRGIIQNKVHFLQSIPFAVKSLKELNGKVPLPDKLTEIRKVFDQIFILENDILLSDKRDKELLISITSFSYKKGIPKDFSGNGGGHVFDCRALPNPGRIEKYRSISGQDQPVVNYLANFREVDEFIDNCSRIVEQSIHNYLQRDFKHLSVSFGCTGGQHRSVYCAQKLFERLKQYPGLKLHIVHKELKD